MGDLAMPDAQAHSSLYGIRVNPGKQSHGPAQPAGEVVLAGHGRQASVWLRPAGALPCVPAGHGRQAPTPAADVGAAGVASCAG
jgi:hypothetical protein